VSRIFASLAVVSLVLFFVALGLGLRVGGYNELYADFLVRQQSVLKNRAAASAEELSRQEAELKTAFEGLEAPQGRARVHMYSGILAALVGLLVNSISVTYFIGTSRWCKEVVDTYRLSADLSASSTRLKRRSFPFALLGMLTILGISALGAASDPGTLRMTTSSWVIPHYAAAVGGIGLLAVLFWLQSGLIHANTLVVEQILERVREIRREKGLEAS